ncbi:MAG: hypothetical protein HN411_05915 [Waddliaceae bacterium]|jgi:hypothetical protein|nr:hypothetical protein [Waddliaceae bacterium]MBT3579055.1 hypothetical protein [Waddliaceae bacterium]MBT4444488.1 hypothetical protein [Waddliaceae bacterium]MBT6929077.1 hypothetical protein [Waddliaceae bacterium]MBT7264737.1 hypothetical protein [Waddliaceae bacterium]
MMPINNFVIGLNTETFGWGDIDSLQYEKGSLGFNNATKICARIRSQAKATERQLVALDKELDYRGAHSNPFMKEDFRVVRDAARDLIKQIIRTRKTTLTEHSAKDIEGIDECCNEKIKELLFKIVEVFEKASSSFEQLASIQEAL